MASVLNVGEIVTRCPNCGGSTLFVGSGGHLTCSLIGCRNPDVSSAFDELARLRECRDKLRKLVNFSATAQEACKDGPFDSGDERFKFAAAMMEALHTGIVRITSLSEGRDYARSEAR